MNSDDNYNLTLAKMTGKHWKKLDGNCNLAPLK